LLEEESKEIVELAEEEDLEDDDEREGERRQGTREEGGSTITQLSLSLSDSARREGGREEDED